VAAFQHGDRAYLIGEASGDLAAALEPAHVPYVVWITLEDAVAAAARSASPGDVVILTPACASFDQFTGFEHRGEEFRRLVQKLSG
jgi:UDP-N-acetylmuramoylalanine--D-glutamate ligase